MAVRFIRQRIPRFKPSDYAGSRYEDLVPDTLDIQERAQLAVNGPTGPTDPSMNHRLYFYVSFTAHPPSMSHTASDICQTKFMEALPLMRTIIGSDLHDDVDVDWMSTALSSIGPDGLVYWPSLSAVAPKILSTMPRLRCVETMAMRWGLSATSPTHPRCRR
jgi:hypothetical protein